MHRSIAEQKPFFKKLLKFVEKRDSFMREDFFLEIVHNR